MKNRRGSLILALVIALAFSFFGCAEKEISPTQESAVVVSEDETAKDETAEEASPSGEVYILFTSDVHCGVNEGFGYAGVKSIKDNLESDGHEVILVDNGDSIQGDSIGMMTEGESIIELMNAVGYDLWTPGNHEFDYGMEQFIHLTDMADFSVVSCNLNKEGEALFPAYTIIEAAGLKIAFIGITTPTTLASSTPANFQNEEGEYIYNFLQDETGEKLYSAVQTAIDSARKDGADYVYVMGHLGMSAEDAPWTYADVIEHTSGIDVFLDGHSHDTEQVVMKDMEGNNVIRSGCGTKLIAVGYSHITQEEGIVDTDIWMWNNDTSLPGLLGISNDVTEKIDAEIEELNTKLDEVIAKAGTELTIFDPEEKDGSGNPIRMVRRAETNAGDFCADAIRIATGAEIGLINGGGVRDNIKAGDISYGDILTIAPFNNQLALIEATGQQILDALEFGSKAIPDEFGGFLQVSGLTYEIDARIPSPCLVDENGTMVGIEGERRVRNVLVGGEPIDPERVYRVGGIDYTLIKNGDGHTAFNGATVINDRVKPDSQALIEYIQGPLEGVIGTGYEDPYGDGRIVIVGDGDSE